LLGLLKINNQHLILLGFGLLIFFTGFNILEALIPSIISILAGDNRGAGLGV
jgi:hypothetical protein